MSNFIKRFVIAALTFLGMAAVNVAQAGPITWNFGFTCPSDCGLSGGFGNTREFTGSDGVTTVTAKAWGRTVGTANVQFETAFLGHFTGSGLGVTNRDEGSGSSPHHTLDNYKKYDLIAFHFSKTVEPVSALLKAFSSRDSDISVWIANVVSMPNLAGLFVAEPGPNNDLTDLFGTRIDNDGPSITPRTAAFGTGATGNFLIIAARIDNTDPNDFIKIKGLTVEMTKVPEPASMAIFAFGLAGLAMVRRRRSNA